MTSDKNRTFTFGLKEEDIETINSILEQQPKVEQALIFGSRAKGNYKHGSDIDIALKGCRLNLEVCTHISFVLNEETQMPYKFDVLNYHAVSSKELVEHIDRVGIVFYER